MIPVSYNLRNLAVRKTTALAAIMGLALVVFVLSGTLMLSNGIDRTMGRSASPDVAVVLRKGSTSELESSIEETSVNLVLNDTSVAQPASGPRGMGELVTVVLAEKVGASGLSNATLRGVSEASLAFRPGVNVIEGRAPQLGADEVMVGKAIRGRFKGMDVGQTFELRKNRPAQVVGVFEDGGSSHESELWVGIESARTAFGRQGLVSSLRVRVDPTRFDAFKTSVEANRQLNLQVMKEQDFYEKQSEGISLFIKVMGAMIAVFFSIGAMMGAMITMNAAVAHRQREIGTLRALGFGRFSVLLSFLMESVFLSLVGGLIGAIASLAMGLVSFSMINFANWSELVFSFEPTPSILGISLGFASVMGVFGGFLPALRAARISPVDAMRG
jgi:putative ABC transport system permease protein